MKLIEITMTAYKAFYVEAESDADVLESDIVDDERSFSSFGGADWEIDETTARELSEDEASGIRQRHPEWILKEEK